MEIHSPFLCYLFGIIKNKSLQADLRQTLGEALNRYQINQTETTLGRYDPCADDTTNHISLLSCWLSMKPVEEFGTLKWIPLCPQGNGDFAIRHLANGGIAKDLSCAWESIHQLLFSFFMGSVLLRISFLCHLQIFSRFTFRSSPTSSSILSCLIFPTLSNMLNLARNEGVQNHKKTPVCLAVTFPIHCAKPA